MIAVYLGAGQLSLTELPRPVPEPGLALVRVLVAGICNTDLELQRGYYQFKGVPGHEFVGEVVESDSAHLLGQRVVGEINLGCRKCNYCLAGLERHCATRRVLGIVNYPGAFAEFIVLPEKNLHVLPSNISTEEAVFVEPVAAACEVLDQVSIRAGEPVAILGDGKLGLLICQVLQGHGARVHLFGHHPRKLQIAEELGIDTVSSTERPSAQFNFVVECTGSSEALGDAIAMVRPKGTVIMKSTVHMPVTIDTAPVIVNEISLIGSRCGRFEPAIELLRDRQISVTPLLSAEFPLHQAPAAFAEAARRGVLKVLLRP